MFLSFMWLQDAEMHSTDHLNPQTKHWLKKPRNTEKYHCNGSIIADIWKAFPILNNLYHLNEIII